MRITGILNPQLVVEKKKMTQCTQNFFLTHYTKLLVYCLQLLTCVGLFLHTLLRGLSFILSNVLAFPMRVTDRIADLSELITVMVIYDWHFCSFCLFYTSPILDIFFYAKHLHFQICISHFTFSSKIQPIVA